MNALLIVASGKSSRFGGFPKAFCQIGNKLNIQNTIDIAKNYYDIIYVGVNKGTYDKYGDALKDCVPFWIKTGQGDAHSILKCMYHIKGIDTDIDRISICWGDAIFVDATPFKVINSNIADDLVKVLCSIDKNPYAWFDVDDRDAILKSHFAKNQQPIEEGIHDQSLFDCDFDYLLMYLNKYRESLCIPMDNDEDNSDINEMKFLYFFEFLINNDFEPAKCVYVKPGKVFSFNTQEELEEIKSILSMN